MLLHHVLEQHGFSVWQVANGREAVELYRQHHADINVILMDVLMPKLAGPDALREP